jgi:hypothetical protein
MNFCLGLGLGQLTSEGSKWKLTSDLCFWLLQRKGKRGSGGSKWRPEAQANNNKNPRSSQVREGEANVAQKRGKQGHACAAQKRGTKAKEKI